MTYSPNVPQTGTKISATYNLITTNFQQLNTLYALDHYAWNDATVANRGRHRQIMFMNNVAAPATANPVSALYPSAQNLFHKNAAGTTQITLNGRPIWKGGAIGGATADGLVYQGKTTNGFLVFPNEVGFIWGFFTGTGAGQVVTYSSTGVPGWPVNGFLTNTRNLMITPVNPFLSSYQIISTTKTGFTIDTTNNADYYFLAIGV